MSARQPCHFTSMLVKDTVLLSPSGNMLAKLFGSQLLNKIWFSRRFPKSTVYMCVSPASLVLAHLFPCDMKIVAVLKGPLNISASPVAARGRAGSFTSQAPFTAVFCQPSAVPQGAQPQASAAFSANWSLGGGGAPGSGWEGKLEPRKLGETQRGP